MPCNLSRIATLDFIQVMYLFLASILAATPNAKQRPRNEFAFALFEEAYSWPDYQWSEMPVFKGGSPHEEMKEKVDLLEIGLKTNPQWLKEQAKDIAYPYLLGLAWKHPEISHLVKLPVEMPAIEMLIPPGQEYSFEKAAYLEPLIQTYGINKLVSAMPEKGDLYTADTFILHSLAVPKSQINILTMAKYLPTKVEHLPAWATWLFKGLQPTPELTWNLMQMCKTQTILSLSPIQLFAQLYPYLDPSTN